MHHARGSGTTRMHRLKRRRSYFGEWDHQDAPHTRQWDHKDAPIDISKLPLTPRTASSNDIGAPRGCLLFRSSRRTTQRFRRPIHHSRRPIHHSRRPIHHSRRPTTVRHPAGIPALLWALRGNARGPGTPRGIWICRQLSPSSFMVVRCGSCGVASPRQSPPKRRVGRSAKRRDRVSAPKLSAAPRPPARNSEGRVA